MANNLKEYTILIKTELGFESIVVSYIRDIDEEAQIIKSPFGFKGLILVKPGKLSRDALCEQIYKRVPEASKVIPIDIVVHADPHEICRSIKDIAKTKISSSETFAVRTTRRGKHDFTSIDVNVVVGDCVRKYSGASVDLRYPDKIVLVEIIQDYAFVSILPGSFEYHKYSREKIELYKLFERVSIVQMPYLGPRDAIIEMGKRIGREVQNFEVKELIIAPIGMVDAEQLSLFITNVLEGIESRYRIQRKSYSRKPRKVPVYIMDLYQLVRERSDEVIIVFEPEGKYIGDVKNELARLVLGTHKRINLLFGAREGIPVGIYRFADLVVDIAPGITLSTDYAAAAGLIALSTVLYNFYRLIEFEGSNSRSR
ncbi:MAG: SPOUT family RNA methylase [Thermoprotei archaeon]